jgi:hypothetical protein
MTHYVLIIIAVLYGGGTSQQSIVFHNKNLCIAAKENITKALNANVDEVSGRGINRGVYIECFKQM